MCPSTAHHPGSQPPLVALVNPNHPLVKLAHALDWSEFEQTLATPTPETGRPALPTRLMVGLHYLKAMYHESDESVIEKWIENPYWQYFCREQFFQQDFPCHPTSLVKWRKRVGVDGIERLLKQILKTAVQCSALKPNELKCVTVDTTVQEKAIAFPTDARLYDKARKAIVKAARTHAIKLRQSYVRLGKKALIQQSRYASARQPKRAQKYTKQLRTYLGRVIRDVERKLSPLPLEVQPLIERAKQIHQQQKQDSHKCYSVHAPEVECIAKGKAHKRYEFGCKVVLVTTTVSNWIVGIQVHSGNPYDGSTLKSALELVVHLTGVQVQHAVVDRGFREKEHHPSEVEVHLGERKPCSRALKRLLKRRNAIEPIIGHTKQDHALGRNYLKGTQGDCINALLAGCGFNLRKLYRFFAEESVSLPLPAA
jgi:transposase, IS5 family